MTRPAVFAPRAETELLKFLRRVHREQPASARRLRRLVDDAARRLGARPFLGRVEPHLASPRYRFWSLPAFSLLIAYDPEDDPVQVLRIVHTAQDLPRALKELRS